MPSPSVAVLSALVTGKGRPKRLLVPENAPAFIANIGRVAGASALKVSPPNIDVALHDLLRTEGLNPAHIWGVATHRDGRLSPTDWLSRCAAAGVPTIELCMGSFAALVRWDPSPATFTIVDLDAEEAFSGAHLTALLTSDRALAARIQELCLPGPEERDYVFDAWPRGLAHDEPALMSMVEDAIGHGDKPPAEGANPALTLPWTRRFQSVESLAAVEEDRWSTRLAEAEARHTEAIRAAVQNASSLQSRLEQQLSLADEWQRRSRAAERDAAAQAERDSALLSVSQKKLDRQQGIIDQWEARFHEAEAEASKDASILSNARAELLRHKSESEGALASMQAQREALAQKLLRTERERDLAAAAARRDDSERTTLSQLRQRADQFEKAAAASAEREAREARKAEAAEASRALLSARVVRLEAEALDFGKARADLLKQKTEAEQALAPIQIERHALTRKLSDLDAELGEALADAAKRTTDQRVALDEQTQRAARLEREVATLTASAATQAREWEASRTELSERIAALKADAIEAEPTRAFLLTQKAEKERALASVATASEALLNKLSAVEKERDRALADAASREKAQRSAIDGQRRRAELFEAEAAAFKEREARLVEEWAISRAGLSEQMSRMEAEAVLAQGAFAGLRAEKEAAERALAQATAEGAEASEKLAEAERSRAQAAVDTRRDREALLQALDEQRQRGERLEKEAAVLAETSATKVREWEVLRVGLSERIARLEADSALADQARGELLAQHEESERGRALLLSERDMLSQKLAGAQSERDRARVDAETRGAALHAALEEQKQRAERPEKDPALLSVGDAGPAQAWEAERTRMSEQIARLEAAAAAAENAHTDRASQKAAEAAEAERAMASLRAQGEALARKLAEVERNRDLALSDAVRREEAQRAALEEQRQRGDEFERDAAARTERETRLTDEWALLQEELSERIVRMEADAAAAEKARADLVTQKAEGERTLESIRAEAAGREDAQRLALSGERYRVEQLERDAAARVERETKLSREWEVARSESSARIRGLEAAVAATETAQRDLLAQKNDAERALASMQAEREALARRVAEIERDRDLAQAEAARREQTLRAELDTQGQIAEGLKTAAAAAAAAAAATVAANERGAEPAEPWEAPRAELLARIARLEAAEVIADKARTELLNRKRDSDQALSAAQAERTALLKKLGAAEHDRDQAQAAVASFKAAREEPKVRLEPAVPKDAPGAAGKRDTGGLSALVSLWNTAVIRRPLGSKAPEEKPPAPPAASAFGLEEISDDPPSSSDRAPIGEEPGQLGLPAKAEPGVLPKTLATAEPARGQAQAKAVRHDEVRAERVAGAALAPPENGQARFKATAPPKDSGDSAGPRNTGGLSALVSLWNTAATMRPFRRQVTEEKPPDPPVNAPFEYEVIAKEPASSSGPAPTPEGQAQRKPDRPAQGGPPRPNPPRRPEPKPAPVPDKAKATGGWLRGLADRVRGKP